MNEYFCPTCGAILNYQDGFDPNRGFWTCTKCGKLLVDANIYNGDNFEGIAWFCDNCNAFLNKQYGFSDIYTSWTCTECGHINSITENDIVGSNSVKSVDSNDIKCPICGDSLKDQLEYNEYEDEYTCDLCGTKLYRNYSGEPYSVVEDETVDEETSSSPIAGIVGAFLNLGLVSMNLYDTFKSNSNSDDTSHKATQRKHNKGKKN